jgi:hypothetical protein
VGLCIVIVNRTCYGFLCCDVIVVSLNHAFEGCQRAKRQHFVSVQAAIRKLLLSWKQEQSKFKFVDRSVIHYYVSTSYTVLHSTISGLCNPNGRNT